MKLVDLNLLLYAVNEDAPHHVTARKWWEEPVAADEPHERRPSRRTRNRT